MPQPSSYQLHQLLRQLFIRQAREVLSRLTVRGVAFGEVLDRQKWATEMATAVRPLYLHLFQEGMYTAALRITKLRNGQPPTNLLEQPRFATTTPGMVNHPIIQELMGMTTARYQLPQSPYVAKKLSKAVTKTVGFRFDLFNPKVLEVVNQTVFAFCQETTNTALTEVDLAYQQLREELKEGLQAGDALQILAKRVLNIFASPERAFRIAATEASRALHGGSLLAAKESGVVSGKEWLASADACERCLELDGKEVGLDEPFYVDPKGGYYAVVMTPPLHPHCFCTFSEVL